MGNEQSSMRLTEEERAYYRQKGYDDFAEKCRPIDAANAAKRERRQREKEAQATQQPENNAAPKKAANDTEVKDTSDKAASEKVAAKAKADREAVEHKIAEDRKKEQAKKEAAAKKASEIEALKQRSAAAQESIAQSKEAQQAELRDKFRKADLPTRPSLQAPAQPAPRQQHQVDSPDSSGSDDYLSQWGARKERRRVDSPLGRPAHGSKSTDEDALFVSARPDSSRQTSTNSTKQTLNVDTNQRAPPNRASIAHTRRPESSSGAATTPVSANNVSPRSAKASLANTRRPSQSDGALPLPPSAAGAKRARPITSLAGLGPIPKKARTSVSTTASPQSPPSDTANGQRAQPQWYSSMTHSGRRDKLSSGADTLLGRLKDEISNAKRCYDADDSNGHRKAFTMIRALLHDLAFTQVNERVLRDNAIFHNDRGLPRLFDSRYDGGVNWPEDVQADAQELYQKWYRREFDIDIMRGIHFTMSGEQGGDSIDPKAKKSSKYVGNGSLVNGQWWPLLLCAVRDGAHGETIKGIAGERGRGAFSCLLSGGNDPYPDIDEGDIVKYCGTDSQDGKITVGTQKMLDSMANGIPVRFIRSHKAKTKSKYAPVRGFRYDGLYDVKEYEILDHKLQRHRFLLQRRPGQGPIRGGGVEGERPTEREVKVYDTHKRLAGGKAAAYY